MYPQFSANVSLIKQQKGEKSSLAWFSYNYLGCHNRCTKDFGLIEMVRMIIGFHIFVVKVRNHQQKLRLHHNVQENLARRFGSFQLFQSSDSNFMII